MKDGVAVLASGPDRQSVERGLDQSVKASKQSHDFVSMKVNANQLST